MEAGGAHTADDLEDFLEETELIGDERVVVSKIVPVRIRLEGHAAIPETELMTQDITLILIYGLEAFLHPLVFL